MAELIDLKSCPVKSVSGTLLKDRTRDKNIILATTVYENLDFTSEITKKLLSDGSLEFGTALSNPPTAPPSDGTPIRGCG